MACKLITILVRVVLVTATTAGWNIITTASAWFPSTTTARSSIMVRPSPINQFLKQQIQQQGRSSSSSASVVIRKSQARQSIRPTTSYTQQSRMYASTTTTTTTTTTSKPGWIRRTYRRIKASITSQDYTREELKIGIAGFYDRSSLLWENVWGEHMHHGYYIPANRTDHIQAQIDLIDQVLLWANVTTPVHNVVDVGCGIGGSSRHIARKYNCTTEGITLSPYQANRGNELAIVQGVKDSCHFQVADALEMPFKNNTFDLVWSLESGEHMPNKQQFVSELFRVATPGGRIIIVTWCHRDLQPHETSLTPSELRLLRRINRAYYLPQWCSVQDYVTLLKEVGATDIKREDWSYIIAPFWKAVIRSSFNLKSIWGLLRSGFSTQRGAYAMFLMLSGFNRGLIKFGLLTCTKPS